MAYQTVNPYDNQTVATFDDLTDEQLTTLITQAQRTFESWSQKSFAERAAYAARRSAAANDKPGAHYLAPSPVTVGRAAAGPKNTDIT